MMNFAHATVGAVLAVVLTKAGLPWQIAFVFSFGSHFVLDMIPHWDPDFVFPVTRKFLAWMVLDFALVFVLLFLLFGADFYRNFVILGGAFCGILPDLILTFERLFHTHSFLNKLHHWVHAPKKLPFREGIVAQVLAVSAAFGIAFFS